MKEYKLDTATLMGAWYISKKLCDKIKKAMDNDNLTPGIMYRQGQQTVVKEAKESFELPVDVDSKDKLFVSVYKFLYLSTCTLSYSYRLQNCNS